jgi:hypothetical protein
MSTLLRAVHLLALVIGYITLLSCAVVALTIVAFVWREWLSKPWPRCQRTLVVVERNGPFLNPHPRGHQTLHVDAPSPGDAWSALGEPRRRAP